MSTRRTFTLILVTAALVILPATGAFAQTVVNVACTGNAVNDGAALRTAYNGIVGASATSPYVVQPDPCLYDLGTTTLTIRNFIDLIGLGRNDTIITSQVDRGTSPSSGTITVPAGVDAELANLTIRNEDTTDCYAVRNASALFVMEDVIAEAACLEDAVAFHTVGRARGIDLVLRAEVTGEEVPVARAAALEDVGGDSVISTTLMTASGAVCTDGFGAILDGSDATLQNVNIFVECGDATGIDISGTSRPHVSNLKAFAAAIGNGTATGIYVSGSNNVAKIDDARLEIDAGGNGIAYGARNNSSSSSLLLANVTAIAATGGTRTGLQASAGLITADRSTFEGATNSLNVSSGATARIGVSKLNGTRSISGSATCVGAYDGLYVAIGTSCL